MDLISSLNLKKLMLDTELYNTSVTVTEQQAPEQYSIAELEKLIKPNITISGSPAIMGESLLADLEMFTGYTADQETLFSRLDRCKCKSSRIYSERLLAHPINSIDVLNQRKMHLQKLEQLYSTRRTEIDESLKTLEECENSVLFFYSATDEELTSFYDIVYFKIWFLSILNNSDKALTITNAYKICVSPLLGILSPIMYFVVPYFVLRLKFKIRMGFITYLKFIYNSFISGMDSGSIFSFSPVLSKLRYISYGVSLLFYFQNVFSNIEMARLTYKVSSFLTNKVNDMILFTQASKRLLDLAWTDNMGATFWTDSTMQPVKETFDDMEINKSRHFMFGEFGKQLSIFKRFDKLSYLNTLKRTLMLDSLFSFVSTKQELVMNYVAFKNKQEKSLLSLKGMFHPSIDQAKVVRNDLSLNHSMMLTGPNAGGKSTFIKAVLLSVLLAQTITIVPAENATITPFYVINSQINIPDCKGKESLFEAEMNRSKQSVELLKQAEEADLPSIIVMDEIFNSTNPVEGIAGAYAIAKKLASFKKSVTLITTHYVYLTKLKKETNFENYRMNITHTPDGTIEYPYKLSKGVSQQYIALELLKARGFDQEIVDEALKVRDRLTKKSE